MLEDKIKEMVFQPQVLSSQVTKILMEAILEGILKGGQRLAEKELQKQFGISRSPLREAYRELEKRGLIVIIPRKGAFVKSIDIKDIEDNFPVRAVLEGLAAKLAHSKMSAGDLNEMREILNQMAEGAKKNNIKSYWRLHQIFHEIFINASDNDVLIGTLNTLRMHSLWYRFSYQYYQEDLKKHIIVHEHIYRLFKNRRGSLQKLENLVKNHIEDGLEKFIKYLHSDESPLQVNPPNHDG